MWVGQQDTQVPGAGKVTEGDSFSCSAKAITLKNPKSVLTL